MTLRARVCVCVCVCVCGWGHRWGALLFPVLRKPLAFGDSRSAHERCMAAFEVCPCDASCSSSLIRSGRCPAKMARRSLLANAASSRRDIPLQSYN